MIFVNWQEATLVPRGVGKHRELLPVEGNLSRVMDQRACTGNYERGGKLYKVRES